MTDQAPASREAQFSGKTVSGCPLPATYTNVFRASGSPEELILDFGLDAHRRTAEGGEAAVMVQRLVLSWGNAKRLAVLLRDLVQMHERAYGAIPLAAVPTPPTAVNGQTPMAPAS